MFVGEKTRANTPDYLNYVVEIKRDEWGGITLSSEVGSLEFKSYNSKLSRKYTYNYNFTHIIRIFLFCRDGINNGK